jgi:hypothetical protein
MVLCWLSTDPLAEDAPGLSPYVYCENNPLNMTDPDGRWPYPIGPINLIGLYYKAKSYFSGSSSSSRSSSIGGGGGSGQGGIMLSNSKGGSSGQTDLIRKGGRQGSDVMWGDASGFVQAGSFATSLRDGIKYNGSAKMVAKIVKETTKGLKIGDKIGGKLEGSNSENSSTNSQSGSDTSESSAKNMTSVNVFDSKIITDSYGDSGNPIIFERSVITPTSVSVPDNKKSIDSVKAVYEKKAEANTKKVNKQWD